MDRGIFEMLEAEGMEEERTTAEEMEEEVMDNEENNCGIDGKYLEFIII